MRYGPAVTGPTPDRIAPWRGIALILVALALSLRVLVPAGYMVAPTGAGLPLTLCTGQGPVTSSHDPAHPAPGPEKAPGSHGACLFAGTAAAPPPPLPQVARTEAPVIAADRPPSGGWVAPGRGLAAPPPPSRGPPVLLS